MAISRYKFKKTLAYNNRAISTILSSIATNNRILLFIQSSLPSSLAAHVVGCAIKNDSLFIYAESATWATKLRFHGKSIQKQINQAEITGSIKRVNIRITSSERSTIEMQQRPVKLPTTAGIAAINNLALGTDGDLHQALLKLSKTLKSKTN